MNGHYKCSTVIEKVTYFRSANPLWQPLSAAVLLHVQGWSHHDRSRARSSYHEAKKSNSWARPFLCGRWYHENLDALRFHWRSQPPTAGMLKRDPGQDLVICFFSASYLSRIALLPKRKSRKGSLWKLAFKHQYKQIIANRLVQAKIFSQLTRSSIGSIVLWHFSTQHLWSNKRPDWNITHFLPKNAFFGRLTLTGGVGED